MSSLTPESTPLYPDLADKVAVVTGGSRGIGRECCRALAINRARIAVVSRSQGPIDETVEECRALGAEAIGISADATSITEVESMRAEVERNLGTTDILLPFAGGFGSFTTSWEIGSAEWQEVMDENLYSTHAAVSSFIPDMIERRSGSIVTMASISGRFLDKLVTASYAAAKAGVVMYTRHTAIEAGPFGVRVNSIAPGTVGSERIDRIMEDDAKRFAAELSPLGRMGTTEDCALATIFLASDSAAWMTGVTLDVNGGRAML